MDRLIHARVDPFAAFTIEPDGSITTSDLTFAAYCLINAVAVTKIIPPQVDGWFSTFTLSGTEAEINKLSVSFANSESAQHADAVRRLKRATRALKERGG